MDIKEPATTQDLKNNIQLITWQEAKTYFKAHNPTLHDIIAAIGPDSTLKLIHVRYPFGAPVIRHQQLYLPLPDGSCVTKTDTRIHPDIRSALNYSHVPLAFAADKSFEIYINNAQQSIPLYMLPRGDILGAMEFIEDNANIKPIDELCVQSGARTTFMLPKLTDSASHKRLIKEFKLRLPIPRHFYEHQPIFSHLVNSPAMKNHWLSEMIFFSKEWVEKIKNDSHWLPLKNYFYQHAWQQARYWRMQSVIGVLWRYFATAIQKHHLKPNPYLVETVKHILFIAAGAIPGFRPQGISQQAMPVKLIQEIYTNCYGLRNQFPTIMAPEHAILAAEPKPLYYSLSLPTVLDYCGQQKQQMTIIEEERTIKTLINTLKEAATHSHTSLTNILRTTHFDYFHTEQDLENNIKPSTALCEYDRRFTESLLDIESRQFAATSIFFRGTISITTEHQD